MHVRLVADSGEAACSTLAKSSVTVSKQAIKCGSDDGNFTFSSDANYCDTNSDWGLTASGSEVFAVKLKYYYTGETTNP